MCKRLLAGAPPVVLFLLAPITTFPQAGPGGVGNSSSNVLWFSADRNVTSLLGLVSAWGDRSGNGRDAALPFLGITCTPNLVPNAANGQPVLRFDGIDDQLLVDDANALDLTSWHFFLVLRAEVQKDHNAWFTKGDDGTENYEMLSYSSGDLHVPVYWTTNTRTAPSTSSGLVGTEGLRILEYSYASGGRAVYMNGTPWYTDTETRTPKANARPVYIGNERGTTGRCMNGDLAEVIAYNTRLNAAQRIIVDNHLAAKYGLSLGTADLYAQDSEARGDYDSDVAGIGRAGNAEQQLDSRGSGVVRITSNGPAELANGEFLFWGHDNKALGSGWTNDLPSGVQGRWDRVWRVSEVDLAGAAADIGAVDMTFDLNSQGTANAAHLRLLVDTDKDGVFSDETAIGPPTSLGGGLYRFSGVTALADGVRFTLGTTNISSTPLPIELLSFSATCDHNGPVDIAWSTATEQDNALFSVERSADLAEWKTIATRPGAGNSSAVLTYSCSDPDPLDGLAYYRLKQTDLDGSSTWSEIVPVHRTNTADVRIFPNPAEGALHVRAPASEDGPWHLLDALGRVIDRPLLMRAGALDLDLSALPRGAYLLRPAGQGPGRSWPLVLR